jgi:hypothetical protein
MAARGEAPVERGAREATFTYPWPLRWFRLLGWLWKLTQQVSVFIAIAIAIAVAVGGVLLTLNVKRF